ncbi:hypothetical protein [Roseateles depolymerans]|uniref:hypothetical protein n=1 Tax=Roseateles depolymerans TaxID=76731 RepID=UPI00073DA6AA|nr:hypothetical protein [Roseateles depolymerans]
MKETLKIAALGLLAAAVSACFFFLAGTSLAQGYVTVGKARSVIYTYAESPVAFSLAVGGMLVFATAVLAACLLIAFALVAAPRAIRARLLRERLLEVANKSIFGVRTSMRWLLACFVVALGALGIAAAFGV